MKYIGAILYLLIIELFENTECSPKVLYAINAGGGRFVDSSGIVYDSDPLSGVIGFSSDYGRRLLIGRSHPKDQLLYQTERYHHNTFGYDIPIPGDGEYVLILKFCEVYFNSPGQKVFDVVLNGEHTVITNLDIFDQVGRGVAHDEYIPFSIEKGKLFFNDEESDLSEDFVRVDFIKGYRDNPKINAIVLIQGKIDEVYKLPPINTDENEFEERDEEAEEYISNLKHASGPKQVDPYSADGISMMIPVAIAVLSFIPLVYCFYKL